jgi:hypothetical protein
MTSTKFRSKEPPDVESLEEGCYDILFHYGYCDDDLHSERTTRGTLTLTRKTTVTTAHDDDSDHHDNNNNNDTRKMAWVGRIEFNKNLPPADALCFNSDYTITEDILHQTGDQTGDNNDNDTTTNSSSRRLWKKTFSVGDYAVNTIDLINPEEDGMRAEMYVLHERVACPWRPVEGGGRGGGGVPALCQEFSADKIVTFASVQQAQDLVQQHYNREHIDDDPNSWLCHPNHLHHPLPVDVAKRILCFAQSRPCPVLFFEPKDWVIKTIWRNDNNLNYLERAESHIVARRRR